MIKNSTIVIVASLLLIGLISIRLIDNIFERKNLIDKNTVDKEIKRMEINEKLLTVEPKLFQFNESEFIYLPEIAFKNDNLDIDYVLYKYENQILVKIPIHN
ncbi:hypothetical protein [Maribellus mangrovi]|uniref:hypothetical protein n=1 Tax=Maribellus mangrovi TaxID=3133146 RepID=UPI0030ED7036